MSDVIEGSGSCLCGAVRINAKSVNKHAGVCHCSMCRKWSGGPWMAVDCGVDITLDGEESIAVYNSSEWAERGFCNKCGSHLFYRLKESKQYVVPVGLFDDDIPFIFDHQIFIDEKPSFYAFANETSNMTGAEVFAKYAPPPE